MEIFTNIWNLLISPRFTAFYWNTGIFAFIGFIALLQGSIDTLGLPEMVVIIVSAIFTQLTKALNNLAKGKEMGFAPKDNY